MQGRGFGRGAGMNRDFAAAPDASKTSEPGGHLDSRETAAGGETDRKRNWLNIITAGAQLTLDVIRVLREAGDFYRKVKV